MGVWWDLGGNFVSIGVNSFVRGHESLDFVFLFRMLRCEVDNLYRLKRESEEGVRARGWT